MAAECKHPSLCTYPKQRHHSAGLQREKLHVVLTESSLHCIPKGAECPKPLLCPWKSRVLPHLERMTLQPLPLLFLSSARQVLPTAEPFSLLYTQLLPRNFVKQEHPMLSRVNNYTKYMLCD